MGKQPDAEKTLPKPDHNLAVPTTFEWEKRLEVQFEGGFSVREDWVELGPGFDRAR